MDTILSTLLEAGVLGLTAFLISLGLTRLMIFLLPKLGMMDIPKDSRRVHTQPVPRGGGIGMVVAFALITGSLAFLMPRSVIVHTKLAVTSLIPLMVLVPLGVIDDRFALRARTKFLFQIIAAALAWYIGVRMDTVFGWQLPEWLNCACTIVWIVAMINAFNMIDGIDGLASGVGIISALCLAVVAMSKNHIIAVVILIIFAGSLMGFLIYNWHPAKLFMGDTGSMFIGYVLAVSGIVLAARTASVVSIFIPLLACGIPFVDITFAVWRRLMGDVTGKDTDENNGSDTSEADSDGKERMETPAKHNGPGMRLVGMVARLGHGDKSHLHHRLLVYFNNNQQRTVWYIYRIALAMGLVGVICCYLPSKSMLLAFLLVLGTFSIIINRLAVIELWNSTELLYHNFQSAHAGIIFSNVLNPIFDLSVMFFAYTVSTDNFELYDLLRHVTIVMVVLMASRNYHVFWNYSSSEDYFRLAASLTIGTLISCIFDQIIETSFPPISHLYAGAIMISALLAERHCIHFLRSSLIHQRNHSRMVANKPKATAIFGIVPESRLYRNRLNNNIESAEEEEIVGLIAHDRHFRHGYCYGMKVLGNVDDLAFIHAKYHLSKLVVARDTTDYERQLMKDFCEENGIELHSFMVSEEKL